MGWIFYYPVELTEFSANEENWTEFKIGNKQKYLKLVGKDRLDNAVEVCQHLNARLPLPKNEKEDADLYNALQALGIKAPFGAAIDANDVVTEGEWVDSSGQPLAYTNWYKNQPSNSNGVDHYALYYFGFGGQWNDGPANRVDHVVCERPVRG